MAGGASTALSTTLSPPPTRRSQPPICSRHAGAARTDTRGGARGEQRYRADDPGGEGIVSRAVGEEAGGSASVRWLVLSAAQPRCSEVGAAAGARTAARRRGVPSEGVASTLREP